MHVHIREVARPTADCKTSDTPPAHQCPQNWSTLSLCPYWLGNSTAAGEPNYELNHHAYRSTLCVCDECRRSRSHKNSKEACGTLDCSLMNGAASVYKHQALHCPSAQKTHRRRRHVYEWSSRSGLLLPAHVPRWPERKNGQAECK